MKAIIMAGGLGTRLSPVTKVINNVINFIKAAFQNNLRLILIITGKGRLKNYENLFNEPGKLKNELPRWIDRSDLNRYVLNISLAHGIHGGDGAYYIYLKKNKSYRT